MHRLASAFDVTRIDPEGTADGTRRLQAQTAIEGAIGALQEEGSLDAAVDREQLRDVAVREAVGLGALEPLLANDATREIVVEGPWRISGDFGRGLEPVPGAFSTPDALVTVARRVFAQAGVAIDAVRPIHEARLPDGSTATLLLAPVAVHGPVLTLRRPALKATTLDELVSASVLDEAMAALLRVAFQAKKNILVTGAVGAGVTTVLGAIASLAAPHQRIAVVENVPDLAIRHDRVTALSLHGAHATTSFKTLLGEAQRLRADLLVIDDISGTEAYDVLLTASSRRESTLLGVHGTSPVDALHRLEVLAHLSSRAAPWALASILADAVHLIVQVGLMPDRTRRVVSITEVTGATAEAPTTVELFAYRGDFTPVGRASFL